MKAVTGELPVRDTEAWSAEVKWDGQRLLAATGAPDQPLRLDTTTGADAVARFPELAGLPAALAPYQLVLDGEAVAFDEHGRPSFGQLQLRMHLASPADISRVAATIPVNYVIFDLLWLNGRDGPGCRIWSAATCWPTPCRQAPAGWCPPITSPVAPTCCRPPRHSDWKASSSSATPASTSPGNAHPTG
jgi:hypothetical protein